MISLASISKSVRTAFSYDAVEEKGRRKPATGVLQSEDDELRADERKKLVSGNRDLARNFSIAGFMVRKHLDFVATHTFQAKTKDSGFNRDWEWQVREWSKAKNCDIAGRHPLRRLIRIAEARRCLDGDFLAVKLASRKLQGIEGDRIKNQGGFWDGGRSTEWKHGVRTDSAGKALDYAVHRRVGSSFEFERNVKAENCHLHGFFDRIDQIRGISPIASGVNSLRDVYECFDYGIAKVKLSQLFALQVFRDSNDPDGDYEDDENGQPKVNFGRGPVMLNFRNRQTEGVEVAESKTPSTETQAFLRDCIIVALKALDLPFSFFREDFTTFFGSRSALMLYLKSAQDKQADVRDLLDDISAWLLLHLISSRELVPPRSFGPRDLVWTWIPAGTPWWDPSKEIRGDQMAVEGTFNSRTRIVQERLGVDWRDIVDELAEENAYLLEKKIPVTAAAGAGLFMPEAQVKGNDDDKRPE